MKWRWMAEQNADTLAALFHEKARFVHMSGTWGTAAEIEIIRSGSIHYKHADVHEVVVEVREHPLQARRCPRSCRRSY
jgi:hypothetical protein